MPRKLKVKPDEVKTEMADTSPSETVIENPVQDSTGNATTLKNIGSVSADPLAGFTLAIESGKALKLSPKTQSHVFFQLGVKSEDNQLYLRMKGNEGGGLHSKEWVSLNGIIEILDAQKDQTIKSTMFKSCFTGSSANNCGFIAAVLRSPDMALLTQSEQGVFLHRLHDNYEENKATLFAMVETV